MRYIDAYDGLPVVELTRRNLLALLAKLDGNPPGSACTLIDPDDRIAVKAVEDSRHYEDRRAGPMHDATEAVLRQ